MPDAVGWIERQRDQGLYVVVVSFMRDQNTDMSTFTRAVFAIQFSTAAGALKA